jgi:peptidoglycan/LPS O-acetylase OafA/YrhL
MKIAPDLSAYLDFLRFFAALVVLLGHLNQDGIAIGWMPLSHFSHEAVLIFFVLSGFIIHNNTAAVGMTAKAYAVARVSRIYSVALPAVAFSVFAGWMVSVAGADRLPSNYRPFLWSDLFTSLLFLNESWTNSAELTMNDPYWSLCYEVWFYVMFASCW